MAWRVGMKAVCIKSSRWRVIEGPPSRAIHPRRGEVFTISDIVPNAALEPYLQLSECSPFALYDACEFRPVKTTDTGFAILNSLLLPKPARTRERA